MLGRRNIPNTGYDRTANRFLQTWRRTALACSSFHYRPKTLLNISAIAWVTGLGNSIVLWSGSLLVGVLCTVNWPSTALLLADEAGPAGLPAVVDTPWMPICFSASAAFLSRRGADSFDVPKRLRVSPVFAVLPIPPTGTTIPMLFSG